jgi:hypothetical protein
MKISTTILAFTMALAISTGFTSTTVLAGSHSGGGAGVASEFNGTIEKLKDSNKKIVIGGKTYRASGSRSNICIKGACDQDRGSLKVGMTCKGKTSSRKKGMEIKKMKCK